MSFLLCPLFLLNNLSFPLCCLFQGFSNSERFVSLRWAYYQIIKNKRKINKNKTTNEQYCFIQRMKRYKMQNMGWKCIKLWKVAINTRMKSCRTFCLNIFLAFFDFQSCDWIRPGGQNIYRTAVRTCHLLQALNI